MPDMKRESIEKFVVDMTVQMINWYPRATHLFLSPPGSIKPTAMLCITTHIDGTQEVDLVPTTDETDKEWREDLDA